MSPVGGNPDPASKQQGREEETKAAALRVRQEAQARLAAIVESSNDAIVSKSLQGIVLSWNAGAQRIFGYTADEVIGKSITLLIPPERLHEETDILRRISAGQRVEHFETIRVTKEGRRIDISVTISPIFDSTGQIIGASKIARDVTLQKQLQRDLEAAKEKAEEANRAKDRFLSLLSHELRTPLTPVLGALSFLEHRGSLSQDLRSDIAMIRRNVETEARLVDDLLDLTRISRGKVELRCESVDAHAALTTTLSMFEREFDDKHLHVTTALRARDHHVWADPGRLQQIFLNLISNATKFTPPGGSITIQSETTPQRKLRMEFSDTGIGIEDDLMPRIFHPFEQGERTMTRQYGGLGLGLSIARSLVEMHRGKIGVTSAGRDRGATFTVELEPLTDPAGPSSILSGGETDPKLRILLVEDHADTRRVMARLLENFGCTVATAGTITEALKVADRQTFDLLISDIGLPDGSGIELMRRLRETQPVRGIAISGYGQTEVVEGSREAGYEEHLVKPINFQTLQQMLQRFMRKASAR